MRWVIGDVHGMLKSLQKLVDAVRESDPRAKFIFTGDYVNRGPESAATIELMLSLAEAQFVRGNHDDIFDLVLHGRCYADNATEGNRIAAYQWFMNYGLDYTFISYGADADELEYVREYPSKDGLDYLTRVVPEHHRNFIRNLPGLVEYEDVFIAHAKWGVKDSTESPTLMAQLEAKPALRHRILWGRYVNAEVWGPKAWTRVGIFGHTPVDHYNDAQTSEDMVPVVGPQIVLVDTAAALSSEGRLTAYCIETGRFFQTNPLGDLVNGH